MANQVSSWEPIKEMITLRQAMDRLFDDSYVRSPTVRPERRVERVRQLPVDAYTSDEAVVVKASLPGVNPDEVDVTLEGENLMIRAEIKADEEVDYIIRERVTGLFARTLTLNVPVQADKISAEFNQGVLILTLPKAEAVKPRKISIKT
jgi:HSP20 family protein